MATLRSFFGINMLNFPNMPRTAMNTRNRVTIFSTILSEAEPREGCTIFDFGYSIAKKLRADAA